MMLRTGLVGEGDVDALGRQKLLHVGGAGLRFHQALQRRLAALESTSLLRNVSTLCGCISILY